jgi:putative transposase
MKHKYYNPDRFTRKSLRLPTRNYASAGAYYVTICAEQYEPVFDAPELRTILEDMWFSLPERFPQVTLDEFVIMPDHVHFILWLEGTTQRTDTTKKAPSLGSVVGAYKSLTTVAWLHHIKTTGMEVSGRLWQENYYERIIRNDELEATRQYIRNNPTKPKQPLRLP